MIKKFLLLFAMLMVQSVAWAQNEYYAPNLELWEIDDFTVKLPEGCEYSEEASDLDMGQRAWIGPDGKFIFFCCYFQIEEDFSQIDRLVSEAAEMGMEVTGDGDIAHMKLNSTAVMSFAANSNLAVGVTRLHPDDNYGICFFVFAPDAPEDTYIPFTTITSIRF